MYGLSLFAVVFCPAWKDLLVRASRFAWFAQNLYFLVLPWNQAHPGDASSMVFCCFFTLFILRVRMRRSHYDTFSLWKLTLAYPSAHKSEPTSQSWSLGLKVSDKLLFWTWSDGLFRRTAVFCAQCSSLKCVSTKRRSVCWLKLRSCCLDDINKSENHRKYAILRLCLCGMSL